MEPDPRDEELGVKSLPSSCKDAWGKHIPPEPPPSNMISCIGERSHQSEITMVEQEPKGGENVNDPSTSLDNPSSTETPISSEQEHQLILLEPDPIPEFGIFGHFVLGWICCWTIEPQGSREVDQVLWKWPSWKWPIKMPFQGTRHASDIMINPVHNVYPDRILTHPELVVIFFHGIVSRKDIAKAWKETWTSTTHINGKEPTFWIKEWLVEDMGENIQILSLSYDTNIYGVNGDVTDIGKNLVQSLVVNRSYENLWCAPIVLVGHSFGGLIIKSLVVEIQRYMNQKTSNDIESAMNARSKDFYDNLTGVIFYGAPHEGGTKTFSIYFAEICQEVGLLNKTHSITQQSFLQNVQVLDQKMEQLSVDFDQTKENLNIYAFVEGQPINQNEEILVSPASAQRLSRNNYYKIEDANHLTICKPPTRDHISYSKLLDCLKICLKVIETFLFLFIEFQLPNNKILLLGVIQLNF
ncbi:unnamed protein product [Sphagnum jensenii]|uniref:DUF676 domain-containing protein n=1 Tax=Sphagnum jensenii TaxID=128206 RepID=A0ABP0XIA8_9BRYO